MESFVTAALPTSPVIPELIPPAALVLPVFAAGEFIPPELVVPTVCAAAGEFTLFSLVLPAFPGVVYVFLFMEMVF
jgi:hypothetical protein